MSKVNAWIFEMQEDAARMSLSSFVSRHGHRYIDIWIDTNGTDRAPEELLSLYEDYYA